MFDAVLVVGVGGQVGVGLAAAVISIIAEAGCWPGLVSWPTVRLAFLLCAAPELVALYPASRRVPECPRGPLRHE